MFHFCHLSKLVRPETYGPYHVGHNIREESIVLLRVILKQFYVQLNKY